MALELSSLRWPLQVRPAWLAATLLFSAAAPCSPASAAIPAPAQGARHWHFQVLLDGRRIGAHDFTVTGAPGSEEVHTRARFSVKALFISLYGYDHDDHEVWHEGCLARIEAQTSDNGRVLRVLGTRTSQGFEVHGPQGTTTLPACTRSFAYWDRERLGDARLLNAQSGEYEEVALSGQGKESIVAHGQPVAAERYSLAAGKFTIDLWYSPDGQWLALQSRTAQGRTLRYEML